MTQLYQEKCVACRRDSPAVTAAEIDELRPTVAAWELQDDAGVPRLDRVFRFPNFQQALDFTNAVGELAEAEGHHPKLVTEWGRVGVTWWTHKIRNLHRNDFIMAAKTDHLFQELVQEPAPPRE